MATDTQLDLWEVFIQSKSGLPYIHAGSVHASDPAALGLNPSSDNIFFSLLL